jgi:SAM-dependent methyltransferase
MTRSEFLKAIRALSVRYVERRGALPDRSPLDSAGKRAAFAGFYAPLHFLTAQRVIAELGGPPAVDSILDAGCGTGVASAAWALASARKPTIDGVDLNAWAVDEARATWRALDLDGRASRGDFVDRIDQLARRPARGSSSSTAGVVFGWSLNELDRPARDRARVAVEALASKGASILILEPIARSLVPWWSEWAQAATSRNGRDDEWRFEAALPPTLSELSNEAGFSKEELTVRSLAVNWRA